MVMLRLLSLRARNPTASKMSLPAREFLRLLNCAVHHLPNQGEAAPSPDDLQCVFQMAQQHRVLPLIADVAHDSPLLSSASSYSHIAGLARRQTIQQAQRTAEFLLLYRFVQEEGLSPVVLKGVICRSLYPHPEQRSSVDEDLLIDPEDFPRYHRVLTKYGLTLANPTQSLTGADEVSYQDRRRQLYIELHIQLFPPDSDAYGDCNALFGNVLDRTITLDVGGTRLYTLAPTDHLIYLICHAYKHFLHSGVGIRQVCDMAMFAEAYGKDIDWNHVQQSCESMRIGRFAAALFPRHRGG